jgi:hypothetical protein
MPHTFWTKFQHFGHGATRQAWVQLPKKGFLEDTKSHYLKKGHRLEKRLLTELKRSPFFTIDLKMAINFKKLFSWKA